MKKYYFNSDLRFSVKEEKNSENLKANQIRVRMRNCGICGSDIHYYLHGENGGRKIMEPLMLGHEAVGEINFKKLLRSTHDTVRKIFFDNKGDANNYV